MTAVAMKFDYYDKYTLTNNRGKAFFDLLTFAFVWLVSPAFIDLYYGGSLLEIFYFFFYNPIGWIIAGYKYLYGHGMFTFSGCLTIIMFPISFVMSVLIGIVYYPYLIICAIKKIITG